MNVIFRFPLFRQRRALLYVGLEKLSNFHVGRLQSNRQSRIAILHGEGKQKEKKNHMNFTDLYKSYRTAEVN